jgi:hypothetical protein
MSLSLTGARGSLSYKRRRDSPKRRREEEEEVEEEEEQDRRGPGVPPSRTVPRYATDPRCCLPRSVVANCKRRHLGSLVSAYGTIVGGGARHLAVNQAEAVRHAMHGSHVNVSLGSQLRKTNLIRFLLDLLLKLDNLSFHLLKLLRVMLQL